MKNSREIHNTYLKDGTSVRLSILKSEHGAAVIVNQHVGNPFNNGSEIQQHRGEIAAIALDHLKMKPREVRYIEQIGQHYQEVPLKRDLAGVVSHDVQHQFVTLSHGAVQREVDRHTPATSDDSLLDKDWASKLKVPSRSKKPPER
jgi:hypothetical protein